MTDTQGSGATGSRPGGDVPPRWESTLDDPDEPLYTVGVVAELMGVDPQVVRGYDQRGLVSPDRSGSGQRRYSRRDIGRLSRAMELADDGIPAAGIERILTLEDRLRRHGLPIHATPDANGPDTGELDANAPGVDAPGVDAPGVDAPGVDAPGADVPDTGEPGTG